jgi:glutamate synthase (ferredoxin)
MPEAENWWLNASKEARMYNAPWGPIGLYDPRYEHDACGIGFVARIDGGRSHEVLKLALGALCNLEHRGGTDADGKSGDGAGILTQLPYDLIASELREVGLAVPPAGDLGIAQCFLPIDVSEWQFARRLIEETLAAAGIPLVRWRAVPTNNMALGARALATKPALWQAIVARPESIPAGDAWERALYLARRDIRRAAGEHAIMLYLPSFSSRTVVYKGLMAGHQVSNFYLDLQNPRYRTTLAVFHQRFSTNTMPTSRHESHSSRRPSGAMPCRVSVVQSTPTPAIRPSSTMCWSSSFAPGAMCSMPWR